MTLTATRIFFLKRITLKYMPAATLAVVDDFLNNPHETRKYAVTLPFTTRGNYPGARTRSFADPSFVPFFERHVAEKVTWFDTHPFSYNGAFQTCVAADGDSWIHHDCTDWAGILFLSPDAPPQAGLTLYRHRITGASDVMDLNGAEAAKRTHATDEWDAVTTVANKFNRLVLFRGTQFHKSSAYFGDSVGTGRLFQVWFFNTKSPAIPRWTLSTKPRVAVFITSTNRWDYVDRTMKSLAAHVSFEGCDVVSKVVYDDWPRGRDSEKMRALVGPLGFDVVEHPENLGLGKTWQRAWKAIQSTKHAEWVFQLEEDVEFPGTVRVLDVIKAYVDCPVPLTQVFLKRQPCYPSGDFIHGIESGTVGTTVNDLAGSNVVGVTQDMYFVAMCSLYPREIVDRYSYQHEPHEHTVRDFFSGMPSGMIGGRQDPPRVLHTGLVSRGLKVTPGQPSWERFSSFSTEDDYHFDTGKPVESRTLKGAGQTFFF